MIYLTEKKLIILLALALLSVGSFNCTKEAATLNGEDLLHKSDSKLTMEAAIRQFAAERSSLELSEKNFMERRKAKQEEIAAQLERRQIFRQTHSPVSSRSGTQVINIPGDYPTLQAAVDAAQPGAAIHLSGEVTEENNFVVIDVEGLSIQAAEPLGATLKVRNILISAPDVEIKDLNLALESGLSVSEANGFSLKNNMVVTRYGLNFWRSSGCTIKNNQIKGIQAGVIFIQESENNLFANNQIEGSEGNLVILSNSHDHQFSNCSINGLSIAFRGIILFGSTHNTFAECEVKDVQFTSFFATEGSHENQFRACKSENGNFGFISFVSDGNSYEHCTAEAHNSLGFYHDNTSDSKVSNCQAVNCQVAGVLFYAGTGMLLEKSSITGSEYGFSLTLCENATASGNEVFGNFVQGINLDQVNGCLVKNNVVNENSGIGISLEFSDDTTLEKNTSQNNDLCDLQVLGGTGNTFSKNNIGTQCN